MIQELSSNEHWHSTSHWLDLFRISLWAKNIKIFLTVQELYPILLTDHGRTPDGLTRKSIIGHAPKSELTVGRFLRTVQYNSRNQLECW